MRILGLDLGQRTLGIALSDTGESISLNKETFRFDDERYELCVPKVKEYVDKYHIKEIVLGLPKHMNGDLGIKANVSLDFKKMLEKEIEGIKVIMQDERLSTSSALKTISLELGMKKNYRKNYVDQLAAQNILQDYLDRKKNINERQ